MAIAAATIVALVTGAGPLAGEHPPLVSPDGTACEACHDDLLAGAAVHAPAADDCTSCHEILVAEGTTTVAMVADEPALCLMCHDDLSAAAEGGIASPHPPVLDSCVTCHDPHGSDVPGLLVSSRAELCAACHERSELQAGHGGQLTASTECTSCHRPHGSENTHLLSGSRLHAPFGAGTCEACHRQPLGERTRLRARGERLCTACHADLTEAAAEGGSTHAALKGERGRAGCLSCHDPHLSDLGKLLTAASPDSCRACHEGVVNGARAAGGHAPAAEDCLNCHLPHASAEHGLLGAPAEELCRTCHDVEDADLVSAHLGADLSRAGCLACHTPHGEGHPKLLARVVHPPVLDGCDTCHEGAADRLVDDGGSGLCLVCHDDVGEAAAAARTAHPAMEVARCADCHNPHASSHERLLLAAGGGVCVDCHDDQSAGPDEVAHGVVGVIGCQACHEPHGGERDAMLRASGSNLCLSCHDPRQLPPEREGTTLLLGRFPVSAAVVGEMATLRLSADDSSGHPVTGHRVLGVPTEEEISRGRTNFTGELDCRTCHDPHKGRSGMLLEWDAASTAEACRHCHPSRTTRGGK